MKMNNEQMQIQFKLEECQRIASSSGVHFKSLNEHWNKKEFPVYEARMQDDTYEMRINGPLMGDGFDLDGIMNDISRLKSGDSVRMIISSPGGIENNGMILFNELRDKIDSGVKLKTEARGIVASAATLPFVAADERVVPSGSRIMIHRPAGGLMAMGNHDRLKDIFDKYLSGLMHTEENVLDVYQERTGLERENLINMMSKETFMTSNEAAKFNFATATKKEDGKPLTLEEKNNIELMVEELQKHFS